MQVYLIAFSMYINTHQKERTYYTRWIVYGDDGVIEQTMKRVRYMRKRIRRRRFIQTIFINILDTRDHQHYIAKSHHRTTGATARPTRRAPATSNDICARINHKISFYTLVDAKCNSLETRNVARTAQSLYVLLTKFIIKHHCAGSIMFSLGAHVMMSERRANTILGGHIYGAK